MDRRQLRHGCGAAGGDSLYGLLPTDSATCGIVTLLLMMVAVAAAFFPAYRAAKIDPMVASRTE
jgi:hypothetical protein